MTYGDQMRSHLLAIADRTLFALPWLLGILVTVYMPARWLERLALAFGLMAFAIGSTMGAIAIHRALSRRGRRRRGAARGKMGSVETI